MRQDDKRNARVVARRSVAALIDVNLSMGQGDLFLLAEDLPSDQQREFVAEVARIRDRIYKANR